MVLQEDGEDKPDRSYKKWIGIAKIKEEEYPTHYKKKER